MCLSGFDCCGQGCGILDFSYVKVIKALIAPQAAKRKGAETSSVQELQRVNRKLHLLSMCDLS